MPPLPPDDFTVMVRVFEPLRFESDFVPDFLSGLASVFLSSAFFLELLPFFFFFFFLSLGFF